MPQQPKLQESAMKKIISVGFCMQKDSCYTFSYDLSTDRILCPGKPIGPIPET
jgi:hypothetical protein